MGIYSKAKKYRKPFHDINEKVRLLKNDLKKTGVVAENAPANSTAKIYNTYKYNPEQPDVFSDVPDPNGVRGDGWTQPSNGFNASDSSTWQNAYNDFSWLYNSNNVGGESNRPVTDGIDINWTGGVAGAGIFLSHIGWGQSLGYLSNAGVYQPLVTAGSMSSGMIPPIERGSHFDGAHYTGSIPDDRWAAMQAIYAKYQSMIAAGNVPTKTIKVWYPWSYFWYGSWAGYSGIKRESDKHILINATFYTKANDYQSQYKAAASTTLLTQNSIDDPNYYPGNVGKFFDWLKDKLDVGEKAFEWLTDKAGEVLDNKGVVTGKTVKEKINSIKDMVDSAGDFATGVNDGLTTMYDVVGVLEDAKKNGDIKNGEIVNGAVGSFENPMQNSVSDKTAEQILKGVDVGSEWMGGQIQNNTSVAPGAMGGEGTMGAKGIHNNLPGMGLNDDQYPSPYNSNGGVVIPDTYAFRPTGFEDQAIVKVWGKMSEMFFGGNKIEAEKDMATMLDQSVGAFLPKTPGRKDPVVHFETVIPKEQIERIKNKNQNEKYEPKGNVIKEGWASPEHVNVDKNDRKRWFNPKDIKPEYPKDPPPKMVNGYHPKMLSKLDTPIPYIKVKRKDLMRAHKLKKYEAQEYVDLVDKLNDYIKRNPNQLAYARERYPKSDPRLATLNYKMDMQLAAADEYVDTQFPENQRLYNKLVKSTKRSITLTDPKTFKSSKGKMTSINKLMRVDYVLNEYDPDDKEVKKKKIKSNKKSTSRFFRKPKKKTKTDILKDKMAVLDNEMKKTMPD